MISVRIADLHRSSHKEAFLSLFAEYTYGMTTPDYANSGKLPENLISEMSKRPNIIVFLAKEGDTPAGFAVAIEGFSTFRAMPILNIHDIGVSETFRGNGVAKALMKGLEKEARKRGCCKLSLEVHEHNRSAKSLYEKMGYSSLTGKSDSERTLFMVRHL